MRHVDIRENNAHFILSDGEYVHITTLPLVDRGGGRILTIKVHKDGRLCVIGSSSVVGLVDGDLLEGVVSKRIEDALSRPTLEWLIQGGSAAGTLVDIARLFGERLGIISSTSKAIMWEKVFLNDVGKPLVDSQDIKRYNAALEICRPKPGQ